MKKKWGKPVIQKVEVKKITLSGSKHAKESLDNVGSAYRNA